MKKLLLPVAAAIFMLASCNSNVQQTNVEPVNKSSVVSENIKNRHSIRSYKPDQVPKATIDSLLQVSINAPSANNKQPWEIIVVQNAETLNKINTLKDGIFHNSPSIIVIARDTTNSYGEFDCGILAQTIMLTAESMDLGTCALGGLARLLESDEAKEITQSLAIPEGYKVAIALSLGYKNETPQAKPRDNSKIKFID